MVIDILVGLGMILFFGFALFQFMSGLMEEEAERYRLTCHLIDLMREEANREAEESDKTEPDE